MILWFGHGDRRWGLQEGVEGDLGRIMVISITHFQGSYVPTPEKDTTGSPLAAQSRTVVFFNQTSATIIPTPFNNRHFFFNDGKIYFACFRKAFPPFLTHLHLPGDYFNWSQPWEPEEKSNLPSFSCLSLRCCLPSSVDFYHLPFSSRKSAALKGRPWIPSSQTRRFPWVCCLANTHSFFQAYKTENPNRNPLPTFRPPPATSCPALAIAPTWHKTDVLGNVPCSLVLPQAATSSTQVQPQDSHTAGQHTHRCLGLGHC